MARGLVSGLVVGGVVSVATLAVVSVLSALPESPRIEAAPGTAPTPETEAQAAQDRPPSGGRDADLAEIAPTTPGDQAGADDLAALDDGGTQPAARPDVNAETGDLTGPAQTGQVPAVPGAQDSAPRAPELGGAVAGPEPADEPIAAVPAQPVTPEVSDAGSAQGAQPQPDTAPEISAGTDAEVTTSEAESVPGATASDGAPDDTASAPSQLPQAGGTPSQPSAGGAQAPQQTETASVPGQAEPPVTAPAVAGQAPAQPSVAPIQPSSQSPAEPPAPRVAALPQSGAGQENAPLSPTIGTPVKPLTERGDGEQEASDAPLAAIRAFAQPFDNPDNKPLMSILLIDDESGLGAEALQGFPYPLSFALDPGDPEAIEKLERYRTAGFEVALLTDLPQSSTAQDAEIAMEAALAALVETVAVVEGVGSGIQGNRALSDQVTAIAQASGRGLVTQSNGLNTVQKLAARKGVPSAVVFRDFDGAGQGPDTIRRFLDQAAFRADQEGAVVMLGRVQPDTISALLLWGLQDRASRVALAPLSATLLREGP